MAGRHSFNKQNKKPRKGGREEKVTFLEEGGTFSVMIKTLPSFRQPKQHSLEMTLNQKFLGL